MKKITVMLTALVLFTAGSSFAQSRPSESVTINYEKITYKTTATSPAAKDSLKNKAAAQPAAPKQANKPKPGTKIAQPTGTKAGADYILTLEPIKGETKN
jgi:hypothetical protein